MGITTDQIIEAALGRLTAEYIFEDQAEQIAALVRGRLAEGAYERLAGEALCEAVTADLQRTNGDKHLRLLWSDEAQELDDAGEEDEDFFAELARAENQGIRRVERLAGDIGYIETTLVAEPGDGAPMISAAMALIANTKALILDLRANRGGSTYGMAYWCSYLFPGGEAVHLTDVHRRTTGLTQQFWTTPYLPGERYLDRPVYVLTGPVTFSGAEDLAYNLKARGRAVLVGESTRGGAHPTGYYPLSEHISVTVPYARSINPVTGGDWEGTGVTPDIAVSAEQAFEVAYQDALEKVADS
ncbi:S41 family peptidase [Kitasatospora acidiphila]|uniref:S41 family peptidase n=1 Tax=Kitasatospora acidiphila TaxID=2567942 RepID=A0A540VY62_9ACTN|nr:S41 family peptidase [Kitasatospora acidiphila]TQF01667.1 S41 family peptidase [Kitasatospora acidiphila]